jgi:hypothetical protein
VWKFQYFRALVRMTALQRFPASDERPGKVAWPGLVFVN